MDDPEIPHQRVAEKMRTSRDVVSRIVSEFNDSPQGAVMRNVLIDRVEMFADEYRRKLLSCKPDELLSIQGTLKAFDLTKAAIESR